MPTITPFLWFDNQAEEAVHLYVSTFRNSRILKVFRSADTGPNPQGRILTITFELDGQQFIALNGGPRHKFNEAISLQVKLDTQEEVDACWAKLSQGGDEGRAGWVKDRYGLSWQIKPAILSELLNGPDPAVAQRVMEAMVQMKKIEIAGLLRAAEGR